MSDYDIMIKWLKYDEDETKKMLARLKLQKMEDLKLQIIAQNPTLLGVGLPGPNEPEVGVEPGGPSVMLNPNQGQPQPQQPPMPGMPPAGGPPIPGPTGMRKYMDDDSGPPMSGSGNAIPEPDEEDIRRFDLDIKDYESEIDYEETDPSEEA
jgi:hypothetical protein